MGILRKGILSAPSGAVGEIVGYRRNGQDIIAKKSVNGGDIMKMWDGMWRKMEPQAISLFNDLPIQNKNNWANLAPPGMSGLEYYLDYNKNKLGQWRGLNFNNLTIIALPPNIDPTATAWIDWSDLTVKVKYMKPQIVPSPGTGIRFRLTGRDLHSAVLNTITIANPIPGQIFSRNLSLFNHPDLASIHLRYLHFTPNFGSNITYIDFTQNRLGD